ncbi:CcdB family protein [Pseudooceanicola sp.]|uniref:CcdB family protein n=1 Tax=Pseudooceanicola sp. TaxID=1914328 RepID=UPI0035C6C378
MTQYCVYRITGNRLVLDVQSDLIDSGTRLVAPLVRPTSGPKLLPRLEPVFMIGDTEYAMRTAELAAIPTALLIAPPITDLRAHDYEIKGALDMVFSGF